MIGDAVVHTIELQTIQKKAKTTAAGSATHL